jgi:hypothetical protein
MSTTRFAIAVVSLALMSAGASAQVGFRIGGGGLGIGLGLPTPPLFRGRESPDSSERYHAPQRVQRKHKDDDDDVRTAKKTPEPDNKAHSENSSIVSVGADKDKPTPVTEQKKTDVAKSDTSKYRDENSTIASVSSSATANADPVKGLPSKTVDTDASGKTVETCKRYFPTVGQTITVPCE